MPLSQIDTVKFDFKVVWSCFDGVTSVNSPSVEKFIFSSYF